MKSHVTDYWHSLLAAECVPLDSLRYFDPYKSSLLSPQPMWTASASNAFESNKTTILARMVSGRYRTEMMCRFWSVNRKGYCMAETCYQIQGDLEHLLVHCPALEELRDRLRRLFHQKTANIPPLHNLLLSILSSSAKEQVKFLLDSTANDELMKLVHQFGKPILDLVLYLTRTWAYYIHRQKMILIGRWPGNPTKPSHEIDNCSVTYPYPDLLPDTQDMTKNHIDTSPVTLKSNNISNFSYITGPNQFQHTCISPSLTPNTEVQDQSSEVLPPPDLARIMFTVPLQGVAMCGILSCGSGDGAVGVRALVQQHGGMPAFNTSQSSSVLCCSPVAVTPTCPSSTGSIVID